MWMLPTWCAKQKNGTENSFRLIFGLLQGVWAEYDDNYEVFYRRYIENQNLYGHNHGVLAQAPLTPPPNAYTVSAVPCISFSHFAVHTYENKPYFFPSVEAGKIYESEEGKKMLPLSITCHHATTDGYHVQRFLKDMEEEISIF